MRHYLDIDLATRTVESRELKGREFAEAGRYFIAKTLLRDGVAKVDPLSPDNPLIFSAGPFAGTNFSNANRLSVGCKSPLTGGMAGSNSGGFWGPELKFAGYDMVIVQGKSESPVYLWIYDDEAMLVSAEGIWGRTVWETEDSIRAQTGVPDCVIASIGPAGENLVRIACIVNDLHRAAGRSGVGAVMGSKNLKAIAVRGTGSVQVASAEGAMQAIGSQHGKLTNNPGVMGMQMYGTLEIMGIINETGGLPTRNHSETQFEGEEDINGEAVTDNRLVANKACFSCTIACGRVTHLPGEAAGKFMVNTHPRNWKIAGEGPEYETAWALGAQCGVSDLDALIKASWMCNDLGVDTISMGATISAAMELYEMGAISDNEAGMEMNFGSGDVLVSLVEKTCYREGIGDALAEGSKRMGIKYGNPGVHMGSKGQEFPAYDPRAYNGMSLAYATNNRGADHLRAFTPAAEIFGMPYMLDPGSPEGKAELVVSLQNENSIHDSTGLCLFISAGNDLDDIRKLLEGVTGLEFTMDDMNTIGERVWNLERVFNLKAGLTKADDTLPDRILKDAISGDNNPAKGRVGQLDMMLPEYYSLRGWDQEGNPTEAKLEMLGIA